MSNSVVLNMDCLEYMRTLPDNYFDLCVADPPYGAGLTEGGGCQGWFSKNHQDACSQSVNVERAEPKQPLRFHGGDRWNKYIHDRPSEENGRGVGEEVRKKIIAWDVAPRKEYFEQIFRISRNQIIWGGNYFELPPTRCFLVWRKLTISESFSMAMAEYAWTSFNTNAKVFEAAPQGKRGDERFHPTQKPVELYAWIFNLFAEKGQKIFDPYLGSGSSRIAAWNAGIDFIGCEIDKTYFEKQEKRFLQQTAQINIFQAEQLSF